MSLEPSGSARSMFHTSLIQGTLHKPSLMWMVGMGEKGRVFPLDKYLFLKDNKL